MRGTPSSVFANHRFSFALFLFCKPMAETVSITICGDGGCGMLYTLSNGETIISPISQSAPFVFSQHLSSGKDRLAFIRSYPYVGIGNELPWLGVDC